MYLFVISSNQSENIPPVRPPLHCTYKRHIPPMNSHHTRLQHSREWHRVDYSRFVFFGTS